MILKIEQQVSTFDLPLVNGSNVRLNDYQGRPEILIFVPHLG